MPSKLSDNAGERAKQFLVTTEESAAAAGATRTVDDWFKVVWALTLHGASERANRLLDDLIPHRDPRTGEFLHGQSRRFLYPNIWLLIGAHILGRFDVSLPLLRLLQQHQTAGGGVATHKSGDQAPEQDMLTTAMAGLAWLYGNELESAAAAADWLGHTLDTQPTPERCLYTSTGATGQLIQEVTPDRRYLYAIDWASPRQAYYAPGAAIVLLTKLGLATGNADYIALAQRYFDLRCHALSTQPEGLYNFPAAGKFGWGSAWLYRATGQDDCRVAAQRIVTYLTTSQLPDGRWPVYHDSSDVNLAAEFAILLTEMKQVLGERPG